MRKRSSSLGPATLLAVVGTGAVALVVGIVVATPWM
jgi:hypothetical protein